MTFEDFSENQHRVALLFREQQVVFVGVLPMHAWVPNKNILLFPIPSIVVKILPPTTHSLLSLFGTGKHSVGRKFALYLPLSNVGKK